MRDARRGDVAKLAGLEGRFDANQRVETAGEREASEEPPLVVGRGDEKGHEASSSGGVEGEREERGGGGFREGASERRESMDVDGVMVEAPLFRREDETQLMMDRGDEEVRQNVGAESREGAPDPDFVFGKTWQRQFSKVGDGSEAREWQLRGNASSMGERSRKEGLSEIFWTSQTASTAAAAEKGDGPNGAKEAVSGGVQPEEEDERELTAFVARLFAVGFGGKTMTQHAKRLVSMGVGGIILFARNYDNPLQLARLCSSLKAAAKGRPLLLMVDQEGGRVNRLSLPFTQLPSLRTIGSTANPKAAAAAGAVLGRELRAAGIDLDLAPVLDVDSNPKNPVIGQRSFGSDVERVSEMGFEMVRGIQRQGVAACVKHYPGHGDTSTDSHLELPRVDHDLQRLAAVELPPFRRAAQGDVGAVMVAHMLVPALEAAGGMDRVGGSLATGSAASTINEESSSKSRSAHDGGATCPATMSKGAISYLRKELGFDGMVITDCLEMGAIVKHFSVSEAAVRAVESGVDMCLICHTESRQVAAIEAMAKAVGEGRVARERVREARNKIQALAKTYYRPPIDWEDDFERTFAESRLKEVGCKGHQDVVAEIMHESFERDALLLPHEVS